MTRHPVGVLELSGQAGGYVISIPFLKESIYEGSVIEATGETVTLPDLDLLYQEPAPYFLHVLTGTATGCIVTILSIDPLQGSLVTETPLTLVPGDRVAIREHYTLADLGALPNFSSVTLYDPDGSSQQAAFVFGNWTVEADTIIQPGEGFVLTATGEFSIFFTGVVPIVDVRIPLGAGVVNIVSGLNPTGGSISGGSGADILGDLPNFSSISVYPAGDLSSPETFTKVFTWDKDPALIDFASGGAVIVVPSSSEWITVPGIDID